MLSGSPIGGTPISAALNVSTGTNQSLTPTGPAVFTWTVPNQTLVLSGGPQTLVPTGPAIFTWSAPNQTLQLSGGNQDLIPTGPAVFTWVAPNQTLVQSITIWNRRMTESPDRVGSRSSDARKVGL